MRTLILAALLATTTAGAALADESVAGDWRANLGSGVSVNMNVTPDGNWSSQSYDHNKVVRQMRGTYTQTKANDQSGVLVFTPTESKVQNGKVSTETDQYSLAQGGNQLRLTSGGDTMVFEKRTKQ